MLKASRSTLNLNSYKLDSRSYEDKLKQCSLENQELKNTISQLQLKEHRLTQQLNTAHQEIRSLRMRLAQNNPTPAPQPLIQRDNTRQIRQIKQQRERASQYKEMYENEMKNKKEISQYYQGKLHALLRDKDMLVSKYEQKIKTISLQSISNTDSSTSLPQRLPTSPTLPQHNSSKIPEQPRPKLPPPPIRAPSPKTPKKQSSPAKPAKSSLDILLSKCLEYFQEMNLSLSDLRYIQQIDRFSSQSIPPKNKYIKLLRDFPFECKDEDQIQKSYEYIVTKFHEQGKQLSGKNIINFIMERMNSLQ